MTRRKARTKRTSTKPSARQGRNCPLCGHPLGTTRNTTKRVRPWVAAMGDTAADASAPFDYEFREPSRTADLKADVVVPALQASISAAVALVAAGLLWGLRTGAIVSGVVFALAWALLLIDHNRALWLVERLTRHDWDRDGDIGEPETRSIRVEVVEDTAGGKRIQYLNLPVQQQKLERVAHLVLERGVNFSRRGLSDVLSQGEYEKLAASLLASGLAVDLPGNNRQLSAAGRSMFRQLLD